MPQPARLALLRDAAPLLRGGRFGRAWRGFETLPSTNTEASAWAQEDAPEGAVVLTEHQSAGRGRHGRRWEAAAGQNLMLSVVLRPALPPASYGLIPLAAALAVADAVAPYAAPIDPAIKWPNDVLLEGRKCCGMLLESLLTPEGGTVILGIGLNVNQDHFPPELEERATSVLLATGRHVPRAALLADLLGRLEARYDELHRAPEQGTLAAYEQRLVGRGRTITLGFPRGGAVTGRIDGVDADGALRLRTDTGLRAFHAGEVTTSPESLA